MALLTLAGARGRALTTGLSGWQAASGQLLGARQEQQDACGVFPAGRGLLAVVADGMGGMAQGGAAAALALRTIGQAAGELPGADAPFEALRTLLETANRAVYQGVGRGGVPGLSGTTLCAVVVEQNRARVFWCGDSRAYLSRGGRLYALTDDHIYARYLTQMVREGVITEEQALANPRRGHLTGYLGMRALEDYSITTGPMTLEEGDRLLLCTDGLYRGLGEGGLNEHLAAPPRRAVGRMLAELMRRHLPGQDNATALVLQWGEAARKE